MRALIEGQVLARLMYSKRIGLKIGELQSNWTRRLKACYRTQSSQGDEREEKQKDVKQLLYKILEN